MKNDKRKPFEYLKGMTKTRINELLKKEQRLEELEFSRLIKPMSEDMANSFLLLLTHTPTSRWPKQFWDILYNTRQKYPLLVDEWLRRHKQLNGD